MTRQTYRGQNLNGNIITGHGTPSQPSDLVTLAAAQAIAAAPNKLANSTILYRQLAIEFARVKGAPSLMFGVRADGFINTAGIDLTASSGILTSPGKVIAKSAAVDANTSAYISFERGLADDLGHTISKSGNGAVSSTKAKFGTQSFSFDGATTLSMIQSATEFAFNSGTPFTFEAWVNFNTIPTSGFQTLFFLNGLNVLMYNQTSQLNFNNGAAENANRSSALTAGTWYKVEFGYNGTTGYLFLNGVLQFTYNVAPSGNTGITLGSNGNSSYFNGYMDDIRLSKGIIRHTASYTPESAPYGVGAFDLRTLAAVGKPSVAPSSIAALILLTYNGTPTVNTDFILSFTRDGGSTYKDLVLTSQGFTEAGERAFTADDSDLTSIATGTDPRWRLRTTTGTDLQLTGAMLQYA